MKFAQVKETIAFRLICILLSAAVVAVSFFLTPPSGLSPEGFRMLAIVMGAMILFISEALPITAVCFAIIVTMKYTGVATMPVIIRSAASSAVFFCIASFGLAAALQNTNLDTLLLRMLYRLSHGDPRRMISVICCLGTMISAFVNNGVAQIVLISIAASVLKCCGDPEPGTSRMAGGLMMGIYVGATAGGMFLPCSNGPNVAIMELSEMISGQPMTFLQWGLYGVPCGLILMLFSAWRLPRYFRPGPLSREQKLRIESLFETIPNRLETKDIKYLIIMGVMVVLWFASNWWTVLDVATIAMAGVVVMMCPGVELLTTRDFKRNFSVMNVVIMLCIFPLASGMSSTGAGEWLASRIFTDAVGWSSFKVVVLAVVTSFLVHCLIPSGSANAVLSATVIGPVLVSAGLPVSAAIVLIGIQAGTGFLFPIEGTWQYTFGTGHYSFADCIKGNWPITLVGMLCCVLLIPFLALIYRFAGLV